MTLQSEKGCENLSNLIQAVKYALRTERTALEDIKSDLYGYCKSEPHYSAEMYENMLQNSPDYVACMINIDMYENVLKPYE